MKSDQSDAEVMQFAGYSVKVNQDALRYLKALPKQLAIFVVTPALFGYAAYYSRFDVFDISNSLMSEGALATLQNVFQIYVGGLLMFSLALFALICVQLVAEGVWQLFDWAIEVDEVDDAAE